MTVKKEFLMTKDEYEQLREQLDFLKNEKMREIADKINQARGYGDLSENAEYDAAKAEQAENIELIREYEEKVKFAVVVADDKIDYSTVNIGMSVKILDVDFNEEMIYTITGTTGADPMKNKISIDSPVARALVGKKVGDMIEVETPMGLVKFKVLEIMKKQK